MSQLKTIQFIHLAFVASILLFSLVVIGLNSTTMYFSLESLNTEPLFLIGPIGALIAIFASTFAFNKLINNFKDTPNVSTLIKFARYQAAFIVRIAIIEGMAFFNIVIFMMTSNVLTLFFVGICLIAIWLARPTKDHIYTTLNLQDSDTLDGI